MPFEHSTNPWDIIAHLIHKMESISKDLAIIVVANLKSAIEHAPHSPETEYFSESELEEILQSFRSIGLYTQLFSSEDAFMSAVLKGDIDSIHKPYKLIYNSAQTGSGPGRKALIPAFCQLHSLATTSSDPYVVSFARQKFHINCFLRAMGLPSPPSWSYHWEKGWLMDRRPPLGTRVILKPTYESASIGIDSSSVATIDESTDDLLRDRSQALDQPLTVQTFVSGFEVEVPVVGLTEPFVPNIIGISANGKRNLGEDILTFDLVSRDAYNFYQIQEFGHCKLDEVKTAALTAFTLLGIRGFGRIDFRIDSSGAPFITDIATNPHITIHSSFTYAFRQHGLDYRCVPLLLLALGCQEAGWI